MKFSDLALILAVVYIGIGLLLLPKYAAKAQLPAQLLTSLQASLAVILPYVLIFTGVLFFYIQFRERNLKTQVKKEIVTKIFREK